MTESYGKAKRSPATLQSASAGSCTFRPYALDFGSSPRANAIHFHRATRTAVRRLDLRSSSAASRTRLSPRR